MTSGDHKEQEEEKQKVILREDGLWPFLQVIAWFLGPVRWVIQQNASLTEVDLLTHSLAFKEYGFQFALAGGVLNILYLSFPHLGAACRKFCRRVLQRSMVISDGSDENMNKR